MIDVHVITGFLGAGKTTIIKSLLKQMKDKKVNLIINEFGKESIDDILLEKQANYLESIHNGSVFCACKLEDLRRAMDVSLKRNPDMIIIETSGLTNPESVYHLLNKHNYPRVNNCYVTTIVDGKNFHKVFKNVLAVEKQLEVADNVIINKWDNQYTIIDEISEVNPNAKIIHTTNGIENVVLPISKVKNIIHSQVGVKDLTNSKYLLQIDQKVKMSELISFVESISKRCMRIKGIISIENKNYLVEAVMEEYSIKEIDAKSTGLVILGKNTLLSKKQVQHIILNQKIDICIV